MHTKGKSILAGDTNMNSSSSPILYIRLRKRVILNRLKPITIGHIAKILTEPELEETIKELVVYEPKPNDGNRILIDMMRIMQHLKSRWPELTVEHFGEPHVLIEVVKPQRHSHFLLFLVVWLLLFVGSGLAIMNFHEDVSMLEVHQKMYKLITGKEEKHPYLLQIPYSIGLGMGMVLFFNRLFKKKFNEEPNPLEVEMFMYQENLNHYVITEEYHKLHESRDESP